MGDYFISKNAKWNMKGEHRENLSSSFCLHQCVIFFQVGQKTNLHLTVFLNLLLIKYR